MKITRSLKSICFLSLISCFVCQTPVFTQSNQGSQKNQSPNAAQLERFGNEVEDLRNLLKIPGMSAVIIKDQKVVWSKGFGYADLEKKIPATPDTLYHIASLTKTFAATLIMQLVEQGRLNLDEPMSRYSTEFKDDSVKIKHLLSHTSEGTPGDRYSYNGARYAFLTDVIEKKFGKSYRELLAETFYEPLGMTSTVPGQDIVTLPDKWGPLLGKENLSRYQTSLSRLAQPYRLYDDEIVHTAYPRRDISSSAGMLSTVLDMAKYDAAIDQHAFLKKETQDKSWTPFISNGGKVLPHGLGWFAESYRGSKLIWHYGYWPDSFSATYVKVPEKNLSLILLANSDALSAPFYHTGGIETSAFACSFLRTFVYDYGDSLAAPHWAQTTKQFSGEISRLKKTLNGYSYDCELASHSEMMKWFEVKQEKAHKIVRVNPTVYGEYVGQYQLRPDRILTISKQGDRLFIDLPRGFSSELFPESETKFFFKTVDLEVVFVRGDKGEITQLETYENGQKLISKRIR